MNLKKPKTSENVKKISSLKCLGCNMSIKLLNNHAPIKNALCYKRSF